MKLIEALYQTLNERKRPEDVAGMILELLHGELTIKEEKVISKAALGSLKINFWGYTSMLQTFPTAVNADKQIMTAREVFKYNDFHTLGYDSVEKIEAFINSVSALINKDVGHNNFLTDRLKNKQRKEFGLDLSKKSYNKKWRILKHLEKKLFRFIRECRKIEFQKISKHALAHTISFDDFSKDANTACFIAYYNARCNLRSEFTNQGQQRAFDEICEVLWGRCKKMENVTVTNWWAVAHIYPSLEVLSMLNDLQKGLLLGKWTGILQDIAILLDETWQSNDFDKQTMIVKKGNDSSTWNNTAGAWNKARDNWINLIYCLGMEYLLDEICFGKVLRLMAADVVEWHIDSGKNLDANTIVWNNLPFPWEVFQGKVTCNRNLVRGYCEKSGIDPEKSGWIAPREIKVAKFKPTPELVNGVIIANPFLANVLKKHKYFSGKKIKPFSF